MAFKKQEVNTLSLFHLVLSILPLTTPTNIDCNGKAFHCVNSTHFMICVDIGRGFSSTVDDFVIPCPINTECRVTNKFECEYPPVVTLPPVYSSTGVTTRSKQIETTTPWKSNNVILQTTANPLEVEVDKPVSVGEFSSPEENLIIESVTPHTSEDVFKTDQSMAGNMEDQNLSTQMDTISTTTFGDSLDVVTTDMPTMITSVPDIFTTELFAKSDKTIINENFATYSAPDTTSNQNLIESKTDRNLISDTSTENILSSHVSITHNAEDRNKNISIEGNDILNAKINISSTETYATSTIPVTDDIEVTTPYKNLQIVTVDNYITRTTQSSTLKSDETNHKIKDGSSTLSTNIPLDYSTLIDTADSSVQLFTTPKGDYTTKRTLSEKVLSLSSLPDITTDSLLLKADATNLKNNVQVIPTTSPINIPLDYSTTLDIVDSSKQILTSSNGDITTEEVTISNEALLVITTTEIVSLKADDTNFNVQDISYTSPTNLPLDYSTPINAVDSSKPLFTSSNGNFATEGVTISDEISSLSSLLETTTTKSLPLKVDDTNFNTEENPTILHINMSLNYSTTADIVDFTKRILTSSSGDITTELFTISNEALLENTTSESLPLKGDDTNFNDKESSYTSPIDLSLDYSINNVDSFKQLFTTSNGDMTTEVVIILDKTSSISTQPEISTTESLILKLDDTTVGIVDSYKEIFTTSKRESTTDSVSIFDKASSLSTQPEISTTKSLNLKSREENLGLQEVSYTSPINIQQDYSAGVDGTDTPKLLSTSSNVEFTTEEVIIPDKVLSLSTLPHTTEMEPSINSTEQTNTHRDISTDINTAQLITTTEVPTVDVLNTNIAADLHDVYHKQTLLSEIPPNELIGIASGDDIRKTNNDIYDSTTILTEKSFLTTSLDGMYIQTTQLNIALTQDSTKTVSESTSSSYMQKFKQYQSTVDELVPTTLTRFDHSIESFQKDSKPSVDLKSSATANANASEIDANREYIVNDGVNTPSKVHDLPTAAKVTETATDNSIKIESDLSFTNVNSSTISANLLHVPMKEITTDFGLRGDNLSTRSITENPKILSQGTSSINTVLENSNNALLLGFTTKLMDEKSKPNKENGATSRPYVQTTEIRNAQDVKNEQYERGQILISSPVIGLEEIPFIEPKTFIDIPTTTTASITFYESDLVYIEGKNKFVTGLKKSEMSGASIVSDAKIFELKNDHNYFVTTTPIVTLQEKTTLNEKLVALSPMLTDSPKVNLNIPVDLKGDAISTKQSYIVPHTGHDTNMTDGNNNMSSNVSSNNTDIKKTTLSQKNIVQIHKSSLDLDNVDSKISKSLNSTLETHTVVPNENTTNNNFSLNFKINPQKYNGTINVIENQDNKLNLSLNESKEGSVTNYLQIDKRDRGYDQISNTELTVATSPFIPEKPVNEFDKSMVAKGTSGRMGLSENVDSLSKIENTSQNYNASNSISTNSSNPLSSQTIVNPVTKNESLEQLSNVPINRVNNTLHNEDQNGKVMFDCLYRYRGRYADNENCSKFYICIGKQNPIVGLCPVNTVFSEIRKQCTKNLSHCVRNYTFYCTSEGRFSDLFVNNIYYLCVRNNAGKFIRYKMQCEIGYHLDKATIQCMPNVVETKSTLSDSENSQKSSDTSGSKTNSNESHKNTNRNTDFRCEKEGKFIDPNDCRKYYVCSKNNKSVFKRKLKSCDSDEVFDKHKMKCVDAESSEC